MTPAENESPCVAWPEGVAGGELLGDNSWPAGHPGTGEPFVRLATLKHEQPVNYLNYFPPGPPSRHVAIEWATGDDGWGEEEYPVAWRDMTDEEWEAASAAYERARDEWTSTCGKFAIHGPLTITGTFETATGSTAEWVFSPDKSVWYWLRWESRAVAAKERVT